MNDEEKEFIENRNLVFLELGKFNVIFEQVTHSFKSCIKYILSNKGLENRIYADCLVDKMTAEPIKSIFQSVINIYLSEKQDKENINKIISTFEDLIEIRNLLIHCNWAIGVIVKEPVEPFIFGIKPRISKNGVSMYNLDFKLQELKIINEKLVEFNDLVYELFKLIEDKKDTLSDFKFPQFEKLVFKSDLKKMKIEFN